MKLHNIFRLGMDFSLGIVAIITAMLIIILPFLSELSKKIEVAPPPQGSIVVEMFWPDNLRTDVDLWVRGDADGQAVGYSNKGGPLFNLLRDDLGDIGDISGRNMEITYSRGLPDGEYVINAHLFNLKDATLPVPIKVVVSMKKKDSDSLKQLFSVNGNLEYEGQEKTFARFFINDGEYVEDSFNTLQEEIRPQVKYEGGL